VKSEKLTLAFIVSPDGLSDLLEGIQVGYPGLEPDRVEEGPGGKYYLVGYALSDELVRERQGLHAEYSADGADDLPEPRVDKVHHLSWSDLEVPSQPFSVLWRGLIYLETGGAWRLQAVTEDEAFVSLDGAPLYPAGDPPPGDPLDAGWHTVEIFLLKEEPGGSFLLEWVSESGERWAVAEQDLFALESFEGWTHVRQYRTDEDQFQTRRLDGWLDYGSKALLPQEAEAALEDGEIALTGEVFSSSWTLREEYPLTLHLEYCGGKAVIAVDGQEVKRCRVGPDQYTECTAQQTLSAGKHEVSIHLAGEGELASGGRLLIVDAESQPLPDGMVEISPF
jgi:hypothetical protein